MKLSEVSTAEPKKLKLSDIQSEAPASDKAAFGVFPKPGMEPETDPNKKTFLSEAGDVVKAGGYGALAGYFTPELMTAGGALAATNPVTLPAAPYLFAGGQLARGARLAGAVGGGLAGATGKTLGKVVPDPEKVEVDIPGIRLTRKQLAETAGEFAGPGALKGFELAARGSPIVGSAIRSLERFGSMGRAEYADAAARELALIAKPGLRERFAGSAVPVTEIKAYRDIYDSLAGLDSAKRREGEMALEGAKTKAQKVISYYSEQARRVQQFDVAEAQRLREKGNTDAQQVIDDAISQVEQRFGIVRKAEAAGKKAVASGQEALASVGNAQRSRFDIGTALQNKVKATDDVQVKALKDAFDADQAARNKIVADTNTVVDALLVACLGEVTVRV